MLNRILLVVLISIMMVSDALAEVKRLAVLEFRSGAIDSAYLLNLSDQSRRAAVEILSDEEYLIMTRENMMQILTDMGKDASCMEGTCEVEIGRNVGADVIITGDVLQIESTYVLTLKLYDTLSGGLLHSVEVEAADLLSLKRNTHTQSLALLQTGLKLEGQMAPADNVGFQGTVKSDDWFVAKEEAVVVEFASTPIGAVVLVDGQMLCTATPCSKEISKKNHQVVFQKERYFPYQMTVDTRVTQQVDATLEANFGTLNITALDHQNVQMELDGKSLGRTPIKSYPVDSGMHTVTVQDPCYVGQEYRFQMQAGDVEPIEEYPVTPRESALSVKATDKEGNPVAATVKLNGKKLGVTPMTGKVPLCSSNLRISMDGEVLKPELSLKEHQLSEIEVVMGSDPPRICTRYLGRYPEYEDALPGVRGLVYALGGIFIFQSYAFVSEDAEYKKASRRTGIGVIAVAIPGTIRMLMYNKKCTDIEPDPSSDW